MFKQSTQSTLAHC